MMRCNIVYANTLILPLLQLLIGMKEEISKLVVKCEHQILGCQWRGEFKDYLVSDHTFCDT